MVPDVSAADSQADQKATLRQHNLSALESSCVQLLASQKSTETECNGAQATHQSLASDVVQAKYLTCHCPSEPSVRSGLSFRPVELTTEG